MLDSTQELPESCGDLHLDAKINAMQQAGYTIHVPLHHKRFETRTFFKVCQGMLPNPKPSQHSKNQLYDLERLNYEIKKKNQASRVQKVNQDSAALQQLLNLGMFSREQCEQALRNANGNPQQAANILLQM